MICHQIEKDCVVNFLVRLKKPNLGKKIPIQPKANYNK